MILKILWLYMVLFHICLLISKCLPSLSFFSLLINHFSEHATVGFFWLNAAEGWIDVLNDKLNTKVRKSIAQKKTRLSND